MNKARSGAALTALNGSLYVVGGHDGSTRFVLYLSILGHPPQSMRSWPRSGIGLEVELEAAICFTVCAMTALRTKMVLYSAHLDKVKLRESKAGG